MTDNNFISDLILIFALFILVFIIVPILIGALIAYLSGASGYNYYFVVILLASIIWLMICIYYKSV